jgi:alpha-tubulin suppressor-like RCC1 family protein
MTRTGLTTPVIVTFALIVSICGYVSNVSASSDNVFGQDKPMPARSMIEVVSGANHTCAILTNGTVKCWGLNSSGQLGKDSTANLGDASGEMAALSAITLGTNKTAVSITAGGSHTCALLNDATVKCWGLNSSGQLGQDRSVTLGDTSSEMVTLSAITLGTNKTAVSITAGTNHSCALLNDATVKCWGLNSSGQLGKDSTANLGDGSGEMANITAINLGTNKTAVSVTAGGSHTCALLNDATVKCWGLNSSGQLGKDSTANLGDGSGEMANITAINLGTNKTAVSITAGTNHSCALLNDATVKCWGSNIFGSLGQDSVVDIGKSSGQMSALAVVNVGTNKTAILISAGGYHSCVVLNDGNSKCWGLNGSGQLGQNKVSNVGDAASEMAALNVLAIVPPGPARSISVTAGYLNIKIAWVAPTDSGQSNVSSYTVTASPGGTICATSLLTCTISSLSSSIAYTFTVKATNSIGTSASSIASSSLKPLAATVKPGSPTGFSASVLSGKATVSWVTPSVAGSSPISGYSVTSTPGQKGCTVGAVNSCVITGLTNGISYTFTIYAFNAAGRSPSVTSSAKMPMWSTCHSTQPQGYWLAEQDGTVYSFGQAPVFGSPTLASGRTAVDIERTSSSCGYWVLDSAGTFHRFGDAAALPQANLTSLVTNYDFGVAADAAEIIVSAISTADGKGAYIFSSIGRVIRVGTAPKITDTSNRENLLWIPKLNSPIVDARLTTTGNGYWMLAEDGGIFSFGDAKFSGSVPQRPSSEWLGEEIISFAPDLDGTGYVIAAKSGKAWWFEHATRKQLPDVLEAAFGTRTLNASIVAVMARRCGGYLMVANDGGVFATPMSDCGFQGSLGANPPDTKIIALAPLG